MSNMHLGYVGKADWQPEVSLEHLLRTGLPCYYYYYFVFLLPAANQPVYEGGRQGGT